MATLAPSPPEEESTSTTSIVYVTQTVTAVNERSGKRETRYDLSAAEKFGPIHVMIKPGLSMINKIEAAQVLTVLNKTLRYFTDDDYLLPMGDPGVMMAAGAIASRYNNGRFKLLKYERRKIGSVYGDPRVDRVSAYVEHSYIPVQIDIGDIGND